MSSPNCLRPAVPPKPEKDKVSLSLSSPRGDPLAVVNPGMKQTVGTQVNIMMMRQPSPASSSSGTSILNKPDDLPRLKKPALPPKPRPPPINSALPKRPSSVQASIQSPPLSSNTELKKQELLKDEATKSEPAPVARIDEFDNLSDLSLSPQSQVTSPVAKPPLRPPPRVFPPSPRSPPPPIPNLNNATHNQNTTHNISSVRGPPPAIPGNLNSQLNKTVFKFPSSANAPLVTTSKIFTPGQIQLRQAKSASLGRSIIPPPVPATGSAKKSSTLSRVSPLDLSWNSNLQNQFKPNPTRTAPVLTGSNNRPVNFPRPITFASESKVSLLPPPPPPRQRKNRLSVSSSGASLTSPTSPGPGFTSQTESNSQNPSKPVYATVDKEKKWAARMQKQQQQEQSHLNNNSEKVSEDSQVQSISQEQDKNSQELIVTKELEDGTMETESVVKSSLTITPSWLGRLIEKEGSGQQPHVNEQGGVTENEHQQPAPSQVLTLSQEVTETLTMEVQNIGELQNSEIQKLSEPQRSNDIRREAQTLTERQSRQDLTLHNKTPVDISTESNEATQFNGEGLQNDNSETSQNLVSENGCTPPKDQSNPVVPNHLCKNESFLFAMQESVLLIPEADRISNASEEVSVSKDLDNNMNGYTEAETLETFVPTEVSTNLKEILRDTTEVNQNHSTEETTSLEGLSSQQLPPLIRQASLASNFETSVDVHLESFNHLSTATFTESDVNVSALRQKYSKQDPNAVLQVADSQLQRFQHLLQDLSNKKVPIEKTDAMGSMLHKEPPNPSEDHLKLILDNSKSVPEHSSQSEDCSESLNKTPINSDRDIVSALLLSKFEKKGFAEDFLTPDISNDEELKRRSWNTYSDASISPSESSSSSCSHIHQSGLKGSQYCHYCRRKQAGSSWADEDESTG
ncbi:unnamed protein product [Allacma fusca]|uniref:Uncharacterized protein n=1 Tax=Allacma fusca TaxID=39272 RepID=A0A8J2JEK1_9HEXA|nr:unnamed protein product [Allacma fusca]